MEKQVTNVVVGAGAVGLTIAHALLSSGHNVQVVARGSSVPALREQGIRGLGRPQWPEVVPGMDSLIAQLRGSRNQRNPRVFWITTKIGDNAGLVCQLKGFVSDSDVLITVQNGLRPDLAFDFVPERNRCGATIFVGVARSGPGELICTVPGRLVLCPIGHEGPAEAFAERLAGNIPELPTITSRQVFEIQWQKLIWNAVFNSLTAITGETVAELVLRPDGTTLANNALRETTAVAAACGYLNGAEDASRFMVSATDQQIYTSMMLDRKHCRRWERQFLIGEVLLQAEAHAIETPLLSALNSLLIGIECSEGLGPDDLT